MKYYTDNEQGLFVDPIEVNIEELSLIEMTKAQFDACLTAKQAGLKFKVCSNNTVAIQTTNCDVWNPSTEQWDLHLADYLVEKKAQLKSDLEAYRWSLNRGSVDELPEISYVRGVPIIHNDDARIRLSSSIENIKEAGYTLTDTYDDFKDAFGSYPEITYGDIAGNPDTTPVTKSWSLMLGETEAILFNREKVLRAQIDALTTQQEVDQFNVVSELDLLVKVVLMSDPTTYAYPIKYYNQDNP